MLLVGAGLLLRSFRNLVLLDMGFRPENVVVGRVALPPALGEEPQRIAAFFDQLALRVGSLPGARAAGLASIAPFSGGDNGQIFMIRGREPAPGQPDLVARVRVVTPGYFAAVGTPLLRGRLFEEGDRANAPHVALVDETLARRFWPDGNAIGHEVRLGNAQTTNPWLRIVGVVPSVTHQNVGEDANRYVYVPFAQDARSEMDVVVRSTADPAPLVAAIRRELASLDRSLPLYEVHTLEAAVARSLGTRRVTNALLVAFAVAALLLASLGVYGVMAQNVSNRVNEFGIRLALGAAPRDVLGLVLGQGLRLVAAGVAIGLAGAAGLGRLLGSLLFHVKAFDPATLGGVVLVLALVAVGACYLPARRATATDPLRALRYE
jgi:putative ABC transport system permease protein